MAHIPNLWSEGLCLRIPLYNPLLRALEFRANGLTFCIGLRLFIHNIEKAPWFDAFQNAEKLKKVYDVPMLLIHGRLDRQVRSAAAIPAAELAAAAAGIVVVLGCCCSSCCKNRSKNLPLNCCRYCGIKTCTLCNFPLLLLADI